ncbi:hypothetical protein [Absidia glauca]|uniref:Uncharacterized protein n=1 Tax=Absidia glauca TaxID=4829 RepID=A0A163M8P0_ABSGL|nr:hypothetical protein [Absidia glauca]
MNQTLNGASSWGSLAPERSIQQPDQPLYNGTPSETQDEGSSDEDYYDDDEEETDDEYAPVQMGAWGAQPSGADPNSIQMPDWNDRPTDGTPSLTFTSADWGKLCDPNVVVKAGIGSGNLHRKGANYRPVDEQMIVNQRLKIGPPIPSGKKKKKGSKKKGGPPPAFHPSIAHRPKGNPVPSSRRPPIAQSVWGSGLAETPFWESGGALASKHAPPPPPPQQQPPPTTTQRPPPTITRQPDGGTAQRGVSKWHTQPLQVKPTSQPTPAATATSKWANQPLQENSTRQPAPATPAVSKWANQPLQENAPPPPTPAPAPSSASKWANQPLQENHVQQPPSSASKWANQPLQENPVQPPPTPASKWANQPLQENPVQPPPPSTTQYQPSQVFPSKTTGTAASKYAPRPPQQPQAPQQAPQQASQHVAIDGTISLTGAAPITPPRKTIFQLNIELIPGVSAILPVYETDDYSILVKEFGAKHHLTIAPEAEFTFAEKIKQMVAALRKQQQEN